MRIRGKTSNIDNKDSLLKITEANKEQHVDVLFEAQEKRKKEQEKRTIYEVPVDRIVPDPYNARSTINEEKIIELAESIKQNGLQQPIKLFYNEKEDNYVIIFGERRWRAFCYLGLNKIPATIEKNISELEKIIFGLVENTQRVNLTDVQKAKQILLIKEKFPDVELDDIAKKLGYSKKWVSELIKISYLPEEIQLEIENIEGLTARHIKAIYLLKDLDESWTRKLISEIKNENYSGNEAIDRAKQFLKENNFSKRKKSVLTSSLSRLSSRLDKIKYNWDRTSKTKKLIILNELEAINEKIKAILELEKP